MRAVTRGAGCAALPLAWCLWREADGRVDDVSWFVALRARVVVDVLAAENRVARLHVLQRTLPRRCVKDGGVDKLCCDIIFDAASI